METIVLEISNSIATLTINRPKQLNALNSQVLAEVAEAIETLDLQEVRCLVITGAGERAFVAGADISEMLDMDVRAARAFSQCGNLLMQKIENLAIPVIAAVNGYALGGGCELALSCDLRIASEKAVFALPETTLGITPGFGGTQRLPRLVGMARAKEMIYTAQNVNAQAALEMGLVNHVYSKENFLEQVQIFAAKIAGNAPIAVQASKTAVNRGMECDLGTATALEAELFAACFPSEDRKQAMQAFVSKSEKQPFQNR